HSIRGTRREVTRDERRRQEGRSASEVNGRVDHLRLARERVTAGSIRWVGVTVVAPALCVDDVTAQSDQGGVEPLHVETYRRQLESPLNSTVAALRRCRCGENGGGEYADVQSGSTQKRALHRYLLFGNIAC